MCMLGQTWSLKKKREIRQHTRTGEHGRTTSESIASFMLKLGAAVVGRLRNVCLSRLRLSRSHLLYTKSNTRGTERNLGGERAGVRPPLMVRPPGF